MAKILILTNREFLRDYRRWKIRLKTHVVDKIEVKENGHRFVFSLEKKKAAKNDFHKMSWHEFLDWLEHHGPQLKIKRIPLRFRS